MRTTGLDKLYSRLDPTERYRLLMQAIVRGDQAERDRLFGSSPCVTLSVPDLELRRAHDEGVALVQGFTTAAAHRLGALEVLTAVREAVVKAVGAVVQEQAWPEDTGFALVPSLALVGMDLARRNAAANLGAMLQGFSRVCREGVGLEGEVLLEVHAPWFLPRLAPHRRTLDDAEVDPALLAAHHEDLRALWQAVRPEDQPPATHA